jgi:hypothetical protein
VAERFSAHPARWRTPSDCPSWKLSLEALARTFRRKRVLESGVLPTIAELAEQEGLALP